MEDQLRFINEALEAHNKVRRMHGVPELRHNSELSQIALKWAKYIASRNCLQHSTNTYNGDDIGENIAMWFETGATHYDGSQATMQWYNEIKDYNFDRATFTPGTGHFTQVVWKSSSDVGFGFARSPGGAFYAVANYYPAGNYTNQFKDNVLPIKSKVEAMKPTIDQSPRFNLNTRGASNDSRNTDTGLRKFGNFSSNFSDSPRNNSSVVDAVDTRQSIDEMQNRFIKEALTAHNECRRKHGVNDLRHNPELSQIALKWAKYIASRNSMQHSKNEYKGDKLGENIAMWFETGASHYDGNRATMQWYNEIKDYNFDRSTYIPGTGHFTQVVWKSSNEVGFGVYQATDGSFYAVANYYPAGNYLNEFKENVLPLRSKGETRKPTYEEEPSRFSNDTRGAGNDNRNTDIGLRRFGDDSRKLGNFSSNYGDSSRNNPSAVDDVDTREKMKKIQDRFRSEALAAHNEYRRKHDVPPLEHDQKLSDIAFDWASKIAAKNSLENSPKKFNNEKIGENIAVFFEPGANYLDGVKVTGEWYNEIKNYKFEMPGFQREAQHFTQVIWKDSKKVGFGVYRASDGSFYVVANYYPAGNLLGRFKDNVFQIPKIKDTFDKSSSKTYDEKPIPKLNEYEKPQSRSYDTKADVFKPQKADQEKFISEALIAHNQYRRKHGVPPLKHNPKISEIAQKWAENIASNDKMSPSYNRYEGMRLGESMSMWGDTKAQRYDGEYATKQWYNGINEHDFNKEFNEKSGTFTQLVWKDCKEVGFGVARASNGYFYAVANYYPSGNYAGLFKQNVFKTQ